MAKVTSKRLGTARPGRSQQKKLGVVEMPPGAAAEELVADLVPCTLDGTLYRLRYTWQALKIASLELRRQGVACNLMQGLDFRFAGPEMVAPLFFAMAYAQHPGLRYAEVDSQIHEGTALVAFDAVATAYVLGMPKPAKGKAANPTESQAQS